MDEPLACTGVPRDLGAAQGSALGFETRASVGSARLLEVFRRPAPALARLDRDLWRHHPQLAERISGLALAAGASRRGLVAALARAGGDPSAAVALACERPGTTPLVLQRFPAGASADAPVVRIERPDAGIPALVAAPAWLAAAVCGVNEAGLAVAASAPEAPPGAGERFCAPALVLVGDCLQRFSTLEGVLAWCARRPVGGCLTLVAADAAGDVGGLRLGPDERTRRVPRDGVLVGSGPAALCQALDKACRDADSADPSAWAAALSRAAPDSLGVWLDPGGRRLGRCSPGLPDAVFAL